MEFEDRQYQTEAANSGAAFLLDGSQKNGLIVLPTGAGKSRVIAMIAQQLNAPLLVFNPSKEILEQNLEKFHSYGYQPGVFSASMNRKTVGEITLATIGSVKSKAQLFEDFPYIIVDECFPGNHRVSTESGKRTISDLVRAVANGRPVPRVLSYNQSTGEMEYKRIIAVSRSLNRPLLELRFSGLLKIRCTPNHPFLTARGWVAASALMNGDHVLSSSPNGTYAKLPNSDQEALIFGGLLGDGSRDKRHHVNGINGFRFIHGEAQREYLEWKAWMFRAKVERVAENGFARNPAYRCGSGGLCFPAYQGSRDWAIEHLNDRILAVSWMDDGHMSRPENCGSLYAVAGSERLTRLYQQKLDGIGIECAIKRRESAISRRPHWYLTLRKEFLLRLTKRIAPYVHPSMAYKIPLKYRDRVGEYPWNNQFGERGAVVLQSVRESASADVFNLQVEDNKTYVITSQKFSRAKLGPDAGLIVHNCHYVSAKGGMYKSFFDAVPARLLGLTATPFRAATNSYGTEMRWLTRTKPRVFQEVIYYAQIRDLMDEGYLMKPDYQIVKGFNRDRLRPNAKGSDYTDQSVQKHLFEIGFDARLEEVMRRLLNKVGRRHILVFTRFVQDAERLVKAVAGGAAVSDKTPKREREAILRDFKSGSLKYVANCRILDTGFDFPELDTVVDAGPTMSLRRHMQKLGRLVRPHSDKTDAWLVDMVDGIAKFGKLEDMVIHEDPWCIRSGDRQLTNAYLTDRGKQKCNRCNSSNFFWGRHKDTNRALQISRPVNGVLPNINLVKAGGKTVYEIVKPGQGEFCAHAALCPGRSR